MVKWEWLKKEKNKKSKKKMSVNNTNSKETNTIDQITFRAIFTNIVAFKFASSTIHARSTV